MSTLNFSPDLKLPDTIVTESVAILAVKGAGKSNAAVVLAEELDSHRLPWVAIDPKGDWWGVRSGAQALQVPVLGGLHGDLPLEPAAGAFIAELIVSENLTCVLDVSEFDSKAAQQRFLADFGERLFRLHGRDPQPRHVILEEADEIVPQRVFREQARTVGAWTKVVKQGRQRGLGITLVSQRSAVINKDALTQTGTLIVLRTTSPQDRKAILDWVDYHAVARELVESLPSLKDGEAWICSPHFLGVVERVRIRRRRTFDSGATPVAGQSRKATRLADIDLGALQARMAETVERAQADDPKVLRKQIAELKREAAKRSTETQVETVTETVEVPVLADADLDRLAEIVDGLSAGAGKIVSAANEISAALGKLQVRRSAPPVPRPQPTAPVARPPAPTPREQPASDDSLALGKAHRAILGVLAQREGQATSKRQLAVATGYAIGGGGFNNPLGALRTAGLIDGRDPIFITPAGTAAIDGQYEPLPTGPDLLEHWCRLGKAHGLILRALAERYPESMSKQELADATGYEAAGGGFNNPLGKLRTLELIEGRSDLRLTDALGEELLAA